VTVILINILIVQRAIFKWYSSISLIIRSLRPGIVNNFDALSTANVQTAHQLPTRYLFTDKKIVFDNWPPKSRKLRSRPNITTKRYSTHVKRRNVRNVTRLISRIIICYNYL